jgi:hypothetical protein
MHRCLVAATICLLVSERAAVAQSPAPIVANLSLDELSLRVKVSDRGVLAEGVRFVQKPFSVHTLASSVRETLASAVR